MPSKRREALTGTASRPRKKTVGSRAAVASDLVLQSLVLRTCPVRTSTESSAIPAEGFRDFLLISQTSDKISKLINPR